MEREGRLRGYRWFGDVKRKKSGKEEEDNGGGIESWNVFMSSSFL